MTGLAKLPPDGFEFFAVPPKVRAFGTFHVRAFAATNNEQQGTRLVLMPH